MEARENNHPITMRSLVDPRRISIEPFRGWQILDPLEFWRFRELLLFLAWRDIRVRYRQTLIGAAWAVVQPACMVVVFSLFLGKLAHVSSTDVPYPLFAFCGLLPWIFFSTAVNSSANSVLNSEKLVTKVYFPRIIIPLAATGSAILDLLITTSMLGMALLWFAPNHLAPTILLAPVFLLCIGLTAVGLGSALAALNVAYRDFKFILPLVMQVWLFATPSIYLDIHSPEFPIQNCSKFSVGKHCFERQSTSSTDRHVSRLYARYTSETTSMIITLITSLTIFMSGVAIFRWFEHRFADII